jgi:hypothetical protein
LDIISLNFDNQWILSPKYQNLRKILIVAIKQRDSVGNWMRKSAVFFTTLVTTGKFKMP